MTTFLPINEPQQIERVVGNREPIGIQCQDAAGNPVNLEGRTVVFRMVARDKTAKVDNQAADLVDAGDGRVSYEPTAADVDTKGRYSLFILDITDVPHRRWPATPTLTLNLVEEQP